VKWILSERAFEIGARNLPRASAARLPIPTQPRHTPRRTMPPKSHQIFAQFYEERDDNGALVQRRCKRCSNTYKATSTSSSLLHHLNNSHVTWAPHKKELAAPLVEEDVQMEGAPAAAAAASSSSSASVATDSELSFCSPPRAAARPRSVADLLSAQAQQSVLQLAAIAFAKNGIAHRVVQTPSFSTLLAALGWRGAPPTRRSLREALIAPTTCALASSPASATARRQSQWRSMGGPTCGTIR